MVRKDFNFHNATSLFYVLNLYGYTGAGRYNSRSKHNISVGNSDLNIKVVKRYRKYCEYINKSKSPASYVSSDFREYNIYNDDFVYADPPYLQATASYNNNWTKEDTQSLFTKLLDHHNNGGSFALSEFIIHNEQRNTLLDQFIQTGRFNMHFINSAYSSCNCGRKKGYSLEVLVTNY